MRLERVCGCLLGGKFQLEWKKEGEEERNEPNDFIQLLPNLSNHKTLSSELLMIALALSVAA